MVDPMPDKTEREKLVERLKALFPEGNFIYGGYMHKPTLPFGSYARQDMKRYVADNGSWFRSGLYVVRIVTAHKDFDLEQKVIDIFDSLELYWDFFDEAFDKNEQCYGTEFLVEITE